MFKLLKILVCMKESEVLFLQTIKCFHYILFFLIEREKVPFERVSAELVCGQSYETNLPVYNIIDVYIP